MKYSVTYNTRFSGDGHHSNLALQGMVGGFTVSDRIDACCPPPVEPS